MTADTVTLCEGESEERRGQGLSNTMYIFGGRFFSFWTICSVCMCVSFDYNIGDLMPPMPRCDFCRRTPTCMRARVTRCTCKDIWSEWSILVNRRCSLQRAFNYVNAAARASSCWHWTKIRLEALLPLHLYLSFSLSYFACDAYTTTRHTHHIFWKRSPREGDLERARRNDIVSRERGGRVKNGRKERKKEREAKSDGQLMSRRWVARWAAPC